MRFRSFAREETFDLQRFEHGQQSGTHPTLWNLSWPTVLLSALEACLGLVDLLRPALGSLGSKSKMLATNLDFQSLAFVCDRALRHSFRVDAGGIEYV